MVVLPRSTSTSTTLGNQNGPSVFFDASEPLHSPRAVCFKRKYSSLSTLYTPSTYHPLDSPSLSISCFAGPPAVGGNSGSLDGGRSINSRTAIFITLSYPEFRLRAYISASPTRSSSTECSLTRQRWRPACLVHG
jgi:hypothetical protein